MSFPRQKKKTLTPISIILVAGIGANKNFLYLPSGFGDFFSPL
jgi:hypothetical protein